jgi:hypothetical protein
MSGAADSSPFGSATAKEMSILVRQTLIKLFTEPMANEQLIAWLMSANSLPNLECTTLTPELQQLKASGSAITNS